MRAIEKRLRNRIRILEEDLVAVQHDRGKFRDEFSSDFRWLIKIHGERNYPSMTDYVEHKAKALSKFQPWVW